MVGKSAVLSALAFAAGSTAYNLVASYDSSNFFDEFSFYTGGDPTHGFVDYAAGPSEGLAYYAGSQVYMGVDYTTYNPSNGRPSIRVSSNTAFTHGLFIGDFAHIPGSICGSWPAFWTVGPNWPNQGEIDIIEGVNQQYTDSITLHTAAGCDVSMGNSIGGTVLQSSNCNDGNGNTGCSVSTAATDGYGNGFNNEGGGIYAMQWASDSIAVWTWTADSGYTPSDIADGNPDPSTWGPPTVTFIGCDFDSYFSGHQIIFDITFCGDWAGSVWSSGSCANMADTCNDYVAGNPSAFSDSYWLINSVKVYQ